MSHFVLKGDCDVIIKPLLDSQTAWKAERCQLGLIASHQIR